MLSSMMEDFMGDGESETLDDLSEVTTDESFVSLLFQAENNRMETRRGRRNRRRNRRNGRRNGYGSGVLK